MAGSPHPSRGCSMNPKTVPPRPSTQRTAPTKSTRTRSSPGSRFGTTARTSASVIATSGRLIRKIQRQEATPRSQPPKSGPTTVETPLHAVHVPIAAPRSSPSNVAAITASELGVSSAPAIPCTARAPMSRFDVGASAQRSDAAPKAPTPSAKIRRSPYRSPSDPPTRISEPSVSR